jgi:signal transduction histidine kinase
MKIITKFVGSSVAVFGLIISLIGGSTVILEKTDQSVEESRIKTQKAMEKVVDLEFSLSEQVASLKDYLFLNNNSIDLAKYQKAMSQFLITLDELENLDLDAEKIAVIRRRHQNLTRLANNLKHYYPNAADIQQDVRAINSFNQDLHLYIDTLLEKSKNDHQISLQEARQNRRFSNRIQYGTAALVLFIFVIHLKLIILPIFDSIDQLNLGAIKIGKGDFKSRLNIQTKDEVEQLANNFNHMAEQLDTLYQEIDQKIKQLNQTNHNLGEEISHRKLAEAQLQDTLQQLKQTQSQLIQTEKMSSLGQMVAGIAHEINNPVGFIHGNLDYAMEYTQDLLHLIELYQEHYPEPVEDIEVELEELDIEFLTKDFTQLMNSMKIGTERIRTIVKSLRTFSRLDEAELKEVDLHEGIDSTLMILKHRIKAQGDTANATLRECPGIQIIKDYGDLPLVDCYSGQLNQVFMNLFNNAIDALEEKIQHSSLEDIQANPYTITIKTQLIHPHRVQLKIIDSGAGIPDQIKDKLFDPFFTTKPVGKGTGLGLSICYQIIVDRHQGQIECHSIPGEGTEFVIEIPTQRCDHTLDVSVA